MSKILVVSSFSEEGYEQYGNKFLASFIEHWPKEVHLLCGHHTKFGKEPLWKPDNLPDAENVQYVNLDEIPEVNNFKKSADVLFKAKFPQLDNVPWQLDVIKFTNKVFTLAFANKNLAPEYDWIVWLDADTITNKQVTLEDLTTKFLDSGNDIVHLGRVATNYSETSFIGFNSKSSNVRYFIDNLLITYLSGEYQHYAEWHDGFIFERLLNLHKQHGMKVKNLSPDVKTLEAFQGSVLGEYMTHYKGNRKNQITTEQVAPPSRIKFKVTPQDCVPQDSIKDNINTNLTLIKNWVEPCLKHKERAVMASGGPSLKKYLAEIKKLQEEGTKVFCVKHSYPVLMEAGIEPDFCVILDPREIEGVSTHGVVRKDLFKEISPKTIFAIASMTHPSVTNFFKDKGAKVIGWHAATGELQATLPQRTDIDIKYKKAVTIGTCSAIRGIGLINLMGFDDIVLAGFDSSLDGEPKDPELKLGTGVPKYFLVSLDGNGSPEISRVLDPSVMIDKEVRFWTTGELVALYQDFMGIIPHMENFGIKFQMLNDQSTLIGEGWKRHEYWKFIQENEKDMAKKEMSLAPSYGQMLQNMV